MEYQLQSKDYYKILELPPSATLKEIKSAYRRLAQRYHPDKTNNDQYAAAQFETIKEAYDVLSNPSRKEYYLQQRWYDQVMNKKQAVVTVTPVSVLKQFLDLDKYVSRLDVHRMDKQGLFEYITHLLSDETIGKLNSFHEVETNKSIVDAIIKCCRPLPIGYIQSISERMLKIKTDPPTAGKIRQFVLRSKQADHWNKIKIWLLLAIVLFLSFLIYFAGS